MGDHPAAGSLARLQRQIPYCKAMEILLTGTGSMRRRRGGSDWWTTSSLRTS